MLISHLTSFRPLPSPYVGCAGEGVRWEWLKQLTPTEIQHLTYNQACRLRPHLISRHNYDAYIPVVHKETECW